MNPMSPSPATSGTGNFASALSQLNFNSWWGRHTIEPNRIDLWQLGPLQLWIQQLANHWCISYTRKSDWLDSTVRIVAQNLSPANGARELPPLDAMKINCGFASKTRQDLIFTPALADRSIVTRLELPLEILPRETVQLFVVSPLRLRIELPESSTLIQEIAIHRSSDTWFGPTNSNGELAYANDATAFLDLAQVPLRLHCAVTSISIRNSNATALRIDRVCVPFKRLSLFYSARSGFWTDSVIFDHKEDSTIAGQLTAMQLTKQPPSEASPSQFVLGPRDSSDESRIVRALSHLTSPRSYK